MSINLQSTDTEALCAFRIASEANLDAADDLVMRLADVFQQDRVIANEMHIDDEWIAIASIALARAKAFVEIGISHPAILVNFYGHNTFYQQFHLIAKSAFILKKKANRIGGPIPEIVEEIDALRLHVLEIINDQGNH